MEKYFDICATTPIDKKVAEFINQYQNEVFGNPSSIHEFGQKSKALIERARLDISREINCSMSEIIFTSGGSLSNNIALLGVLSKGDHFITSSYEHPSILKVADYLLEKGVEVSLIKPNSKGIVNPNQIESTIKNNTKLISIMYVNNEIGTINPIDKIAALAKKYKILFHTDAVQAMGKISVDVDNLGIDMMSLSGHKFYGPKGIGLLFVKKNTPVRPIFFGGGQESDLFSGTENVINIGALAKAVKICSNDLKKNMNTMKELDAYFISLFKKENIAYKLNGENRVSGVFNIMLPNTKSPSFIINLDKDGYAISAGSACASGAIKGSHTLDQIGLNDTDIKKSYRISFGKFHTKNDVKNLFYTLLTHSKEKV